MGVLGREGVIAIAAQDPAAAERLATAHAALRADPSMQFALTPPPQPAEPPIWLQTLLKSIADLLSPIGRFLSRVFAWLADMMPAAPAARAVLWVMLAILAAGLLWLIVERVRSGRWRLPRRPTVEEPPGMLDWTPEDAPSPEWLREADRLAGEGRHAEAIHYLLLHSIDEIAARRPRWRRPSLTSRELASASLLPMTVRPLFARIAALVERSLFGGSPVGPADWGIARAAYAELAMPDKWRA